MPKRKKTDAFDDLSALFALIPWWVPILLAVATWFAIPALGPRFIERGKDWRSTWRLVGGLAALVLVLTGISGQFLKRKRRALLAQAKSLATLQALSWREFEQLCAEVYRRKGYTVAETVAETAAGADGGVDLVLRKGRERIFVQCKHFAVRRVDVRPIRELFGVMAAEGASGGIFMCSGTYTSAATQFARGKNLELVDGPELLKLLSPLAPAGRGSRGGIPPR